MDDSIDISEELKIYVNAFKEKAVRFMSRHNPNALEIQDVTC